MFDLNLQSLGYEPGCLGSYFAYFRGCMCYLEISRHGYMHHRTLCTDHSWQWFWLNSF